MIDLMKIPSMSSTRIARALHKNGIEKLSELAISKNLSIENILIDLGGNFFVAGKSIEMSMQEMAKLMIADARNHIQNEMGLRDVKWSQQSENLEQVHETEVEVQPKLDVVVEEQNPKAAIKADSKKRKAEPLLKLDELKKQFDFIIEPAKRKKTDLNVSADYRRKLRSSVGAQEFVDINTQFLNDFDKKAENDKSALEITDENASLFLAGNLDNNSVNDTSCLIELSQKHMTIVDVLADEKTFQVFVKEFNEQKEVAMSVGIQKFQLQTQLIGGNLVKPKATQTKPSRNFIFDETFYIDCVSFCYNSNRVCYLNLQNKNPFMDRKVEHFLRKLISRTDLTLKIHEAREHLKLLQKALASSENVNFKLRDPRLGSWLIDPDTNLTWHQMVQKFSPDHLEILDLVTKTSTVGSFGLNYASRVDSKVRTAVECFLTNILIREQMEMMNTTGKSLTRVFCDLEMPIQLVLMKMESSGFPINESKLLQTIESATLLSRQLEQHIYELNGRKFNLTSSKEVSKVVGIHRNLEKKKVSTAKNVLAKLDLPIADCIVTYRTLIKTISNMQPMIHLVKNGRIYGNSFSLTQTGRISMYEPNLQNVTKDFNVEFKGEN